MTEKLQKILARQGLGSRRKMEDAITQGRVSINGVKAQIGDRVDETADIRLDGHLIKSKSLHAPYRVLMYHKPEGEICTRHDPQGRKTVFERLPRLHQSRWIAIGRLDINTCGLLLFTTDGELAHRMMHPRTQIEREYAVRVFGQVHKEQIEKLKQGVTLDDGPASFEKITHQGGDGMNQWYHVTLREGRQREVRRLWESQGLQVSRLMRIRYGNLLLDKNLPRGGWLDLEEEQIHTLRESVGLTGPFEVYTPNKRHHRLNTSQERHKKNRQIRRAVHKHLKKSHSSSQTQD